MDFLFNMRQSRRVMAGNFRDSGEPCAAPAADPLSDLFSNDDVVDSFGQLLNKDLLCLCR